MPGCLRLGAGLWANSIRERQAKMSMPGAIVQCVHILRASLLPFHQQGSAFRDGGQGAVFRNTLACWLGWNAPGLDGGLIVSYLLKQEIRLFVWDSRGQDRDQGVKHCGVGVRMDFGLL